jgi:hypothetical protein
MLRRMLPIFVAFALLACETVPPAPQFVVKVDPRDAEVTGGMRIQFHCEKKGPEKDAYEYTATLDAPCKLEKEEQKGCLGSYLVEADCLGGKGAYTVVGRSKGGETRQVAEFSLKQKLSPREVLPARPDPVPSTWQLIDGFDGGAVAKDNPAGGVRDTWTFNNGKCAQTDGPEGTLRLAVNLPLQISQCGFVEHLKVKKTEEKKGGKPVVKEELESLDLTGFQAITFQVKSADDKPHALRFEIVDRDPLGMNGQGQVWTADEVVIAKPFWRRYEFPIADIPQGLRLAVTRSLGFKLDGKDGFGEEFAVLVDNLALVR